MTKPLSFAAQAVMDAAFPVYDEDEHLYVVSGEQHAGLIAAAALKAAADQVVPDLPKPTDEGTRQADTDIDYWEDCQQHRAKLLAIAAELEVS